MRNASGHRGETVQRVKKKKANRNTYDNSSIKRVTWKFHPVVVQNNGKEMYKKKCTAREKCFFFFLWGFGGANLKLQLKKKKKKRATCFTTLVQNEFISDVASFTTDFQSCLLQSFCLFVFLQGVKRAPSLFNSFCSNVAKISRIFYLLPLP